MGNEGKVRVPAAVLAGLEAVRTSGLTNMGDWRMVIKIARWHGDHDTAIWVQQHPRNYMRGVMSGFVAEEKE